MNLVSVDIHGETNTSFAGCLVVGVLGAVTLMIKKGRINQRKGYFEFQMGIMNDGKHFRQ
jgi:hypothetical protein